MYRKCWRFEVSVTEKPDTLRSGDFANFDVLLSNWNSWPENDLRWPPELEEGLLEYIRSGGGMVFFHASTSAFYEWPEFREISTAAWVEDTWHGEKGPVSVSFSDHEHPITAGLSDFRIFDELWINAGSGNGFQVLGTASAIYPQNNNREGDEPQPAVFVKEYGKGRIFHTILGHDPRAVRNTGFQILLLRGTEWAATGEVSLSLSQEFFDEHAPGAEEVLTEKRMVNIQGPMQDRLIMDYDMYFTSAGGDVLLDRTPILLFQSRLPLP
jgi:type 1 glutamine amidotransferase